jgi:hypothetical protein
MTAKIATDQLTRALLDMAARGERTHCSDPITHDLWLSESDSERATAVMLCDRCPVEAVCRETAELRDERWGVWGGRDFSVRPGRKKARSSPDGYRSSAMSSSNDPPDQSGRLVETYGQKVGSGTFALCQNPDARPYEKRNSANDDRC